MGIVAASAAVALLAGVARAEPPCPAVLRVLARPAGSELARLGLDPEGGFALSFRHSVTLRTVIDRYRVEDGRIVQVELIFDAHGPGLPDVAGPDLRFLREGERIRVAMHRPIERLLLRPSPESENRLEGAGVLELASLGSGAIELAPVPCPGRG